MTSNSSPTPEGFSDLDMSTLPGTENTEVRPWEWLVVWSTCLNRFPKGSKHSALPPLHLTRDKHSKKTSPAVNLSLPMESLKYMKVSGCNYPSLKRRNHCLGREQRKKARSPDSIQEACAIKGATQG